MCTVLLPPGVNSIAVNKYIISYLIISIPFVLRTRNVSPDMHVSTIPLCYWRSSEQFLCFSLLQWRNRRKYIKYPRSAFRNKYFWHKFLYLTEAVVVLLIAMFLILLLQSWVFCLPVLSAKCAITNIYRRIKPMIWKKKTRSRLLQQTQALVQLSNPLLPCFSNTS